MENRAAKFKKFIERLPRLCSPTICGTLSQPITKLERNNRTPTFEWSLEQKAILSPANITAATSSEIGEIDHSFLHQESEQFFSQKCIAPSPMTTPSTRPYSRSQPAPKNWSGYMFDERDEETDEDEEEDENEDEDEDEDDDDEDGENENEANRDRDEMEEEDEDDDDNQDADGDQHMDDLFLSPPMRSSQSQQRFDIFSPDAFGRVMEDENTLQSTPKLGGNSQIFNTPRARRISGEMMTQPQLWRAVGEDEDDDIKMY